MYIEFIWDRIKDCSNRRKHGVSFEEAKTIFMDDNARIINDPDHSDTEDRFVMLGLSSKAKLLVVCHCYREDDQVIRIISARKATKSESIVYRGYNL